MRMSPCGAMRLLCAKQTLCKQESTLLCHELLGVSFPCFGLLRDLLLKRNRRTPVCGFWPLAFASCLTIQNCILRGKSTKANCIPRSNGKAYIIGCFTPLLRFIVKLAFEAQSSPRTFASFRPDIPYFALPIISAFTAIPAYACLKPYTPTNSTVFTA